MSIKRSMLMSPRLLGLHLPGKYALLLAFPLVYAGFKLKSAPTLASSPISRTILRCSKALTNLFVRTTSLWELFRSLWTYSSPYETYESQKQEDAYWKTAEIAQRELSFSDARFSEHVSDNAWNARNQKQILYYTPRLLPEYRNKQANSGDEWNTTIPTKAFIKWHWLVFPDRPHPTFLQASRLIQRFSTPDLREIYRISRLASSSQIGQSDRNHPHNGSSKLRRRVNLDHRQDSKEGPGASYTQLWQSWLQEKTPDLVICFEEG